MVQSWLAVVFGVFCYNMVYYQTGLPTFGTIGFLILINCCQVFLFLSYPANVRYMRHAYAGILSILAILASTLALFRASEVATLSLGVGSVIMTVVALYLFSLTAGNKGGVVEFVAMPLSLVASWMQALGRMIMKDLPGFVVDAFRQITKNKSEKLVEKVKPIALIASLVVFGTLAAIALLPYWGVVPDVDWMRRGVYSVGMGLVLWPLTRLKSGFEFKLPWVGEFHKALVIEGCLLVAASVIVVTVFMVSKLEYVFVALWLPDLWEVGISSYSEYVRQGFVELLAMGGLVYLVAAVSIWLLRAGDLGQAWLRSLNVMLLLALVVFWGSVGKRLGIYVWLHGLTRARMFGALLMAVIGILTLVLLVRFVTRKYAAWHVFEFGLVIVFLFGINILPVDRYVADKLPPTVNDQTDYVYLSRLSADGVGGWVAAYDWAKTELVALEREEGLEVDEVTARKVVYASDTLSNLRDEYLWLGEKYGSEALINGDSLVEYSREESYESLMWLLFGTNLSEWNGYRVLVSQIRSEELVELADEAEKLETKVRSGVNFTLDRSYDTPLVW